MTVSLPRQKPSEECGCPDQSFQRRHCGYNSRNHENVVEIAAGTGDGWRRICGRCGDSQSDGRRSRISAIPWSALISRVVYVCCGEWPDTCLGTSPHPASPGRVGASDPMAFLNGTDLQIRLRDVPLGRLGTTGRGWTSWTTLFLVYPLRRVFRIPSWWFWGCPVGIRSEPNCARAFHSGSAIEQVVASSLPANHGSFRPSHALRHFAP